MLEKMVKAAAAACIGGALAGAPGAIAQEKISLTAGSGLALASVGTSELANYFLPEVNRRLAEGGRYQIEWTTGWGGTIAGQFDMFEAVEDGIVDIAYVNTLHEGAKLPLEQVTFVTPYGVNDLKSAMSIFNALRERIPAMDEQFLKHNQRRLAVVGLHNYDILSTFSIERYEDLSGRKIGAPGLAANWLTGTGAVPVTGALSEYYNSLKTGVYDGILMFQSGLASFKFYEVAPTITRVGFGSQIVSNITINEDVWQGLPQEVRDVLGEVASEYEDRLAGRTIEQASAGLKTAQEKGATVVAMSKDEVRRMAQVLPNIAKTWAAEADSQGLPGTEVLNTYMQLSRDAGVELLRDWAE